MNRLFADEVSAQAAVTAPSTERHAALMLHAMGEADRAWALARLQPAERARVAPLLDELRELGVPADRRWVAQVLDTSMPATPATPAMSDSPRQRVADANAQRVAEALMAEPAQLVLRVLALGPWPWRDEVLATLRARRGELFDPSSAPEAAVIASPALDRSLLQRLAVRVADTQPAHREAARSAGAWARWRVRFGRWQGRTQ